MFKMEYLFSNNALAVITIVGGVIIYVVLTSSARAPTAPTKPVRINEEEDDVSHNAPPVLQTAPNTEDGDVNGVSAAAALAAGAGVNEAMDSDIEIETANLKALMEAVLMGQSEVIKQLIGKGVDVNATNSSWWGNTALMEATRWNNPDVVKVLLDIGADVNAKNKACETALIQASHHGHKKVVKLLLGMDGIDVNATADYRKSALINASREGHKYVVSLLLEKGADVNAKTWKGWTSLIEASIEGHTEVVKLLLDNGADINAKSNDGDTAIIKASQYGHKETVSFLIERGATPL